MKREYGIPVPRGVRKNWTARQLVATDAGWSLRRLNVPGQWADPTECVAWKDRLGRDRLIVGHYPNGRSATVRIDANGNWKTSFGDVG